MKKAMAIPFLLVSFVWVSAQDPKPLTNDYAFKDGIYMSFEEFRGDNPTYRADQFKIDKIDPTDYDLTKVRKIKVVNRKGKWKSLSVGRIWGLCYDGVPYIYYRGPGNVNNPFSNYAKLTRIDVIGAICMFRLEHMTKSYHTNPFTIFNNKYKGVYVQDMLLDMNSGKVHLFDYASVRHYIRDDEDLVFEMEMHRREINLYDIVFAYNLRHPIYPSPVSYTTE